MTDTKAKYEALRAAYPDGQKPQNGANIQKDSRPQQVTDTKSKYEALLAVYGDSPKPQNVPVDTKSQNAQIVETARKTLQSHQAKNQQKWNSWQQNAAVSTSRQQSEPVAVQDAVEQPSLAKMAEQAQKDYDDYIASDEYKALKQQNDTARAAAMMQGTGIYTARIYGQSTTVQTDMKEVELRAIRDYWKKKEQEATDQKTMEDDLAEFEKWPQADRLKLQVYVENGAGSFNSFIRAVSGDAMADAQTGYAYLVEKYGKDKVDRMSKTVSRNKNEKLAEEMKLVGEKVGNEAAVIGSVSTIPMNLVGSFSGALGYLSELVRDGKGQYHTLDPNNLGNLPNTYSGAVRGQVAENISGDKYDVLGNKIKDGGGLRQAAAYAYEGLMSSADSLARAAVGGGSKAISLGLAATGSFSQTVSDASQRGASPAQAMMLGVVNGGLEVATEYLPLDEILKVAKGGPVPAKQLFKNLMKQAAIEVSEEEVSFLGSLMAEAVILQEKSGYQQQIAQAVANGASYEDAVEQANWDAVWEAAETAIISAFSGGGSALVSSTAANVNNQLNQKTKEQKPINKDAHVELADMQVEFEKETWDLCDRLAKATGRNIKLYQHYGPGNSAENGYFEDGVIYVNTKSSDPVAQIVSHELTHSVEFAKEYQELSRMVLGRIEAMGGDLKQLRQQKADLYAQEGHPLGSQAEVDQEIVAEYVAKNLLTNERQIMEVAQQNRTLAEKIKAWVDKLLAAIGNKDAAERAYLTNVQNLYAKALQQPRGVIENGQSVIESGKTVGAAADSDTVRSAENADTWDADEDGPNWDDPVQVRTWAQNMLSSGQITEEEFNGYIDLAEQIAEENAGRENFEDGNGRKFSIESLPDGKKYVRADRQVIMGNDPDSWSEQVEDYINGKIRRGQDVSLLSDDGTVLTITSDTAGKMSSQYTNKGTTLDEDTFYVKANAAVHIDELVQVSSPSHGRTTTDHDGKHGEFASEGWKYRTAFFRDFDGKYYRLQISVANGNKGSVPYNIGDIEERRFPKITGSSAKGGALNGESSSGINVPQEGKSVKRQYSFAGPSARTANSQTLAEAKTLDEQGVANETIRQQTGWFKGMDGKWRFEVDDSSSRISENVSNYMTLGELLQDAEILKAYPNMEDVSVVFQSLPEGVNATYSPQFDSIDVSYKLKGDPEAIRAAVLHEVQHVIQQWEGFTKGTNVGAWERKLKSGFDSRRGADIRKARETEQEIRRVQQEEPEFYRDMMELDAMTPDGPRGEVNWDTLEQITEDPPEWQAFDARRDELQETYGDMKVWDFMDLLYQQEKVAKSEGRTATELYWDTAGEIEARNTAGRRNLTAEERKNTPPNLGDEDTVFSDETGISFDQQMSDYPYNMQTVIQEYIDSVDEDVLSFVDKVQNGQAWRGQKVTVGTANSRMVEDITRLTGVENAVNCKILMNSNAVEHIQKRHGANGEHDNTMRNNRDIARINYVLQNYDSMELSHRISGEYKNRDGSKAKMVVLSKKINGTYFVIEAVPDTGKIGIVSAYMDKNGASQVPDENAPSLNAHDELASAPSGIVPSENTTVKRQMSLSSTVSRKNVADDLRGILSRGGDVAELRRYISQLERSDVNAERSGRNAYQNDTGTEQSEPQRIISMAKRYGISVDEYLRRNWEQYEVDGQWNADARKALEMERGGRKFSISSTEEQAEQKTAEQIRQDMPAKARNVLMGAQRKLLTELQNKLGVNKFTNLDDLKGIVEEIANAYLTDGRVDQKKVDQLFELAYDGGIVRDAEFYEQYKEIKNHLRNTAVTISEGDSHDIADFRDFKRSNFGTLKIVNKGGLPVDSAYHELNTMAPELFPESITHPADQLVRMAEVARSIHVSEQNLNAYYGEDQESFRKYARHDFENAVAEIAGDLLQVKRYVEDTVETEEAAPTTPEEAAEYYKQLKDARRAYEKVQAKNLLTPRDEMQVGKLLRGEILLEDLDPETDYVKGITAVFEAKKEYERLSKLIAEYKRTVRAGHRETADKLLETANEWKDKKIGLAYSRETMERNIDDIVPDKEVAAAIKKEYFEAVHISEAEATRFKTKFRDRVRGLNLSTKINKGNLVSEAHAVQLLGEAEDNIRVLRESRGRMKMRDGKTMDEWNAVIMDMWKENPGLDQGKIRAAVKEFRTIYDELFQMMNAERVRNGYEPVNYRQGYFPHFQPGQGDGILGAFGKALNIDTSVVALPTTINGLTHTFKPGIQWFGNAQERLGFNTAYDAVEGFDKYIEGVASVIYQTENIQKLRALASQIRYRTSEEGIRKQVDAIRARDNLSEEEKQVQINDIYEHGRYTLSNFVNELDEYTNLLANKKSKLDRTMEAMIGRKAYAVMKAWEARVGANMIAGNLSSALTNFIPLTQAGAQLDRGSLMKGMAATLKAIKEDDGIAGQSSFLTNRKGSDPLVQTWTEKASKKLGTPMELIDGFTSESIVRAAYFQNLKRGMSETEALHQADVFASHVMADRSKGAMPTLFESRNPIFKAFTQFQLEVNNQFSEVFKDLPRGHRERGLAALGMVLLKYFLGAFLYNEVYEYFVGRRAALDPFGILNDTVGDLTGYELPNLVEWGTNAIRGKETSFETDNVGIGTAGKNMTSNLLGELPFSSGLTLLGIETDGGRIPASSAVPDLTAIWDAATTEGWSTEKRWKEVQDELNKLAYVIPPFGGNQIGKAIKGAKAFAKGGSYSVDAEGNDILQYPVYKDAPADAIGNALKMGVFGKSSLPEAQDWVDSGFKSFNAKQTATYKELIELGANDRETFSVIRELGDVKNLKGLEKLEAERAILADAAMTEEEKTVIVGHILGTDLLTESGKPSKYANFLSAMDRGLGVDKYMEMRSQGVDVEEYLELTDAGIASDIAVELAYGMYELDAQEDTENAEYWRLIINASDNEYVQLSMLGTRMSDATFEKLTRAQKLDVSPDMFVSYYESRNKYDTDGNGDYTNAEVKAVIDAMGKQYSNEQKGVLWQMATGSPSTKNNPYNKEAGQKWLDAKAAEKEKG